MSDLPFHKKLLAGTGASVAAALFVTPLDVIKTRLQSQTTTASSATHFTGSLDAFRKIIRHEGAKQLWRGAGPTLFGAIPSVAIYMATYEQLKIYGLERGFSEPLVAAVSGSTARSLTVALVSPIELVRTRMQAQSGGLSLKESCMVCIECTCAGMTPGASPGAVSIMTDSIRTNGVLSLWRGLVPTLARDIPFSSIYWICVEGVRSRFIKKQLESDLAQKAQSNGEVFLINLVSGSAAGLIAAFLTHPFDVVKTRIQTATSFSSLTLTQCARNIVEKEGAAGLMKGLLPRAMKTTPSCALVLVSYEISKKYLSEKS